MAGSIFLVNGNEQIIPLKEASFLGSARDGANTVRPP